MSPRAAANTIRIVTSTLTIAVWWAIINRFGWWPFLAPMIVLIAIGIRASITARRLSRDLEAADRWRP